MMGEMMGGRCCHISQGEQGLVTSEPCSEKGLPALPNSTEPGQGLRSCQRAAPGSRGPSGQGSLPRLRAPLAQEAAPALASGDRLKA